jgi:hypothetical protein
MVRPRGRTIVNVEIYVDRGRMWKHTWTLQIWKTQSKWQELVFHDFAYGSTVYKKYIEMLEES